MRDKIFKKKKEEELVKVERKKIKENKRR